MKKKVKYKVGGTTSPIDMQSIGQTISMASGLASFIPGIGPAIGLGGTALGSLLSNMSQPQKPKVPNYNNTAPFGFFTGGDLNALSSNAVEVSADNPQQVDSVENDKIALDHGEVVTEGKVFSNTLVDPLTNRSFAKLEKGIQKSKGKYEKYKATVGDTETNDDTYYDRLSKATFERQESLANLMGLRNPDGTPVQDKPNGYRFGGKIKYNTGGPFNYQPDFTGINQDPQLLVNPWSQNSQITNWASSRMNSHMLRYGVPDNRDAISISDSDFNMLGAKDNDYMGVPTNPAPARNNPSFQLPSGTPSLPFAAPLTDAQNKAADEALAIRNEMAARNRLPLRLDAVPVSPTIKSTSDPSYDMSTSVTPNPFSLPLTNDLPGTAEFNLDPTGVIGSGLYSAATGVGTTSRSARVNMGPAILPTSINNPNLADKSFPDVISQWDAAKQGVNDALNAANKAQAEKEKESILKDIMGKGAKGLPWGTAGTAIGVFSNLAGILMNKQRPVNYENVGRHEYLQQNLALRRINEGEQTAVNNVMGQSAAARGQVNARSQQVRNANLANIASSTAQALGNVRSQFANQESQTRQAIGARRTGIEVMNLQKDMQVDDINTRERDAQLSQNMKMADNIRKALIEKQWAENKLNYNDILAKMMQTDNFKWDENTRQILFKIQEQEARKQGGK